jgi:hypothetical protein
MAKSANTPIYILWHEGDFIADRAVMRMTPHQRLMYRCLCQVARFCETRPYLPDDDNELYVLADADSLEHWKANREAVLAKFQRVLIDGKPMLAQKRVLSDHADYQSYLEQKSGAGRASANARAPRALNGRSAAVQQSNEVMSNEKINSTDNTQDRQNSTNVSTLNLLTTQNQNSEPENSEPQNLNTSLAPLPTAREMMKDPEFREMVIGPVQLCDFFESVLLKTNPRRITRGKKPADARPQHWEKTWVADFQRLLDSGYSVPEIEKMILYAFGDRWLCFTYKPANLIKNHDKLAKDLKIPVRTLPPEKTAFEKRLEKAQRIADKNAALSVGRFECAGGCFGYVDIEGEFCEDCQSHLCTGGCGTIIAGQPGQICDRCRSLVGTNEFARMTGAKAVT